MRKLLGILFAALLAAGPALAQAPQLGAGQVLGNSTAAQRPARAESVSSILDRAISGTRGAILERGASGWAAITPGAINLPLVSGGAGADPAYAALTAPGGGTGQTLYAVGDILYASTTTALSRLADVATGNVLISGGVNTAPSWGKVTASHLNITATSCTNQYVSAISATGVGTCSTVTAAQLGGLGTGVATALGVNIGAAGAVLVNGGALGSPSSAGTIPAFTLGGTISGGGNQINNVVIGASTPLAGSFTTIAYSTSLTGTSTSANALTAGRQGATNPVVQIDASTALVVTGLKIKGAAAAGGVALSAISSGSNEALTIDALGTGTITLNGTATGNVTTPRVLAVTNATNATTSSNGALNVTGGLGVAGNSVFGGRLTITKNTATATPVNTNTILHLISDDSGAENSIEVTTVKSDSVLMLSRANGTMAARTPLGVDEYVGTVVSSGIDANNGALQQGNAMSFKSTQVWNTGQHGMRTVFYGTLDGTLTYAEWASLRNARLGLNDSNPQYKLTVSKHATAGITDPFGNDGIGMIGADAAGITLSMQTFGTSPNPNITMFKARGTNAAKVAVNSGDVIGQLQAFGYAGSTSQYNGGAGFEIAAGENFGTGAAGTILRLTATPNGSTSQVAAATVYGSRGMFVGTGAADPGAGIIGAAVGVQTTATTVGSLGTCNAAAKGLRKFVTDSNAASYTAGIGAIVASGGTTNVPVICDGTNYRIGANDNLPLSNKAA